ncbi:MAG TPA: hypothetical protein VEQ84_17395 [Vicinamibacteria bacterium]|nr:hypothetical protein [Vicinamibacteria bacterium]
MWSAVLFLAAAMAPAAGPFRCEAKDVAGLPAADAATAVAIVCEELASVSGRSGGYAVSLRALGESVVVSVSHADGSDGRRLVLDGLKEVPTAARRLAEALVLGKPIEETRLVDNLVQSEGRKLVTRSGSRKFELGALALGAGQGTGTGGGFSIAFAYDSPTFAIPAELRFAHSSSGDRTTSLFSIDTGARFFFSGRDVSPFVGGGFSVLYLSLSDLKDRDRYLYVEDSHWGPGLYAEGGFQLFRLHRGRLTAKVRADFPLYSLHPEGVDYQPRGRTMRIEEGARYLVPITFGLTMSF